MRRLCLYILCLQAVSALAAYGGYHGGSHVCDKWKCLIRKLNFTDMLPPKDEYSDVIKGLLPATWHVYADSAVDSCYEMQVMEKYINTCTGQSLMHCVVDKLIQGCPTEYLHQGDRCAPVTSLAGNNFMFSQSRYKNQQENKLLLEGRPARFLESYFRSKCCALPQMFSESVLSECGFTEMLHYIHRDLQLPTAFRNGLSIQDVTSKKTEYNVVNEVYNFNMLPESTTSASNFEYPTLASDEEEQDNGNEEIQDALECCEQIDDFISPEFREECDFKLKWDSKHRLTSQNYTEAISLNTTKQCEDLTAATSCVLNKTGLLNQWGFISHFQMKDRIREYSNYKPSYLYEVFNSAFLYVPRYGDLCDSPRKLFNILDAMLLVCESSKRRTNRQCNRMFAEITNSMSDKMSREALDQLQKSSPQMAGYHYRTSFFLTKGPLKDQNLYFQRPNPCSNRNKVTVNVTKDYKRYDFGVLGLLGTPPPVVTLDLKPKNKTLVLLPVYQRTPKNDSLALNSLHDDGVWRG